MGLEKRSNVGIFTVGHSNVEADRFLALLRQHAIRLVVDVRSVPYSRFNPQFNREILRSTLRAAGITYSYGGAELGGRPDDPSCYEDGEVRYELIAGQVWYQEAIGRLLETAAQWRCAVLCAEEDPLKCHRHHLITQTLLERGAAVWHIRSDGRLEKALCQQPPPKQLSLF